MMKCDICGKKKATVHLTELVDNQVSELHICEDCAREKSVQMEQQFGLADLLAGLSDFGKPAAEKPSAAQQVLQCTECGTTYQEFKKHGRLGCSECYRSFAAQLGSLLKKIHGASRHTGKAPAVIKTADQGHSAASVTKKGAAASVEEGLEELKERLQQAILSEDYERAAELRDRIRSIEKKGQE
jgi:protein arginine kinase activator